MKIVKGEWVNAKECLKEFDKYDVIQFDQYFVWQDNSNKEAEGTRGTKFFIRDAYVEKILNQYDKVVSKIDDKIDAFHDLCNKDYDGILEIIERVFYNARKGYDLNFSDSVIFVLGNLDEAYEMALNVDPDMSPDQFHKATKKLNIVDIKKALQQRFRNEQIARLGNIHLIYPSFSSDTFKKIIELNLNMYVNDVKEKLDIDIILKKSIVDLIYKESVFPTHGTRPIFSMKLSGQNFL